MAEGWTIRRILTPIDGSEFSRYAAQQAIRLAQTHAAEVVFLHVVDDQTVAELAQWDGEGEAPAGEAVVRSRLLDHGRTYLQAMARLAEEQGVAHREELREGDPCAAICDAARQLGADVTVVGRIGRRGARRILMGSITRRLIECSDRPVLVVTGPRVQEPARGTSVP